MNGVEAKSLVDNFHHWEARLKNAKPGHLRLKAQAVDEAGNVDRWDRVKL